MSFARTRRIGTCVVRILLLLAICSPCPALAENPPDVIARSGVSAGLVVRLGCGDGRQVVDLHRGDGYLVQGLETDPSRVAETRRFIQTRGKQGLVTAILWDGTRLPYVDRLVNLIILDGDYFTTRRDEVERVLAPHGVAMIQTDQGWTKYVKPWPAEIDQWTHFLHGPGNNAVANDSQIGIPRTLRWECGPKYCRSHEMDTSLAACVTAGGRLFSIVDKGPPGVIAKNVPDKWMLEARDAFNGILLWERPMGRWDWRVWKPELLELDDWTSLIAQRRLIPATLPRRLVAGDGRLYLTFGVGEPVTAIDAVSGQTIRQYAGTEGADEILLADGMLLLTVRPTQRETALAKPDLSLQARSSRKPMGVKEDGRLVAVDAQTGDVCWKTPATTVIPFTLAANGPRVFYHTGQELICLDRKTGEEIWRQPNTTTSATRWEIQHVVVAYEDVVLLALPKSPCQAFDAATGKLLWTGPGGRKSAFATTPLELFVIDDLVWFPSGKEVQGKDVHTGEVVRTIQLPTYFHTPGHHLRCYRARATTRFILDNKRGIEFLDLTEREHQKNDWVRGACRYGILPANGLIYSTPTPCSCYQTVLLKGFNALAAEPTTEDEARWGNEQQRLVKGPAYGLDRVRPSSPAPGASADWPTLRGNRLREGASQTEVGSMLTSCWKRTIGGKLTQPIVAGGRLFVCSRQQQTLYALDASRGEILWSYVAGAEIDSPPTYFAGGLLFGCRDGWVYHLRADDGRLVWRFRAAPAQRQIVSYGRLESSWPVHGSLLVLPEEERAVVYAAAGRNSYLDGGIHLYGLDVATGRVLYRQRIANPPQDNELKYAPHEMEGAQPDVMVFDGKYLSMQSKVFDRQLKPVSLPAAKRIYATGGLLDDQAWHRNFWVFAPGWPLMNKSVNTFPNVGQLLVHDQGRTYGVKYFTESQGQSRVFYPERQGYHLFCDRDERVYDRLLITALSPSDAPKTAAARRGGRKQATSQANVWSDWIPVRVRAMVKAGATLFVAGPPDRIAPDDPLATFEGRGPAELRAIDAATGRTLAKYPLTAPPVFDGMIAADGQLILSSENGCVLCFGKP